MSSCHGQRTSTVTCCDLRIRTRTEDVTLAARLWLPAAIAEGGSTAIVEASPYRLRDVSAVRDSENHGYLASQGYACLKLDMRGTGDSTGSAGSMLSRQERLDTLTAIDWILAQPWSNGRVVLFGISWGAINALLTAAERPDAVQGIVAISGYHDAFASGLSLKGGCLTNEAVGWSGAVLGYNARPPTPVEHPDGWIERWHDRIHAVSLEVEDVLRHPGRDAYWDERHLRLADVACPTLVLSGLTDGNFTSSIPAALEALAGRATTVIGPWSHRWPHLAVPGPGIDALPIIRGWLDEHVDGLRGASALPLGATAVWVEEGRPSRTYYPVARGRWTHAERSPFGSDRHRMFLTARGLRPVPGPRSTATIVHAGFAGGLAGGEIMPAFNSGPGAEFSGDQRWDDAKALTFDTLPLAEPLEVIGNPTLHLRVRSDAAVAQVCVRLCEVTPTGESVRISFGARNLCLLDERNPTKVEPGTTYDVAIPIDFCSYRFAEGNRIRIAVSPSYWPVIWPSPSAVTLGIDLGTSFVDLPVARLDADVPPALLVSPGLLSSAVGREDLRQAKRRRRVIHDAFPSAFSLRIDDDHGRYRLGDSGIEIGSTLNERYDVKDGEGLSATASVGWKWEFHHPGQSTRVEAMTALGCTGTDFKIRARVGAYANSKLVTTRKWSVTVPRHFV